MRFLKLEITFSIDIIKFKYFWSCDSEYKIVKTNHKNNVLFKNLGSQCRRRIVGWQLDSGIWLKLIFEDLQKYYLQTLRRSN